MEVLVDAMVVGSASLREDYILITFSPIHSHLYKPSNWIAINLSCLYCGIQKLERTDDRVNEL